SPLSGGTREFFDIFYSLYPLPPLKGEVVSEANRRGYFFKREVAQRAGGVVVIVKALENNPLATSWPSWRTTPLSTS
ncbi:MAG: hypothetical protein IJR94_01190, partial [Synergistaceae bacterium]|nr:hypothetical protein [Synergistaceae bacterium]